MKCPLRRWVFDVEAQQLIPEQLDCLKEECAWWDKMSDRCSVYRIMVCLEDLTGSLRQMKEHMPHEVQFRK